jgi:hypothetical protein
MLDEGNTPENFCRFNIFSFAACHINQKRPSILTRYFELCVAAMDEPLPVSVLSERILCAVYSPVNM